MTLSRRVLILLVCLLPFGCALFSAPAFDPDVDRGIAALQEKVGAHFDALQRDAGAPAAGWSEQHLRFYDSVRVDLAQLLVIASRQQHNDATVKALELFVSSIDEIEVLHRQGLNPREVPILQRLLDMQLRMIAKLEQAKPRPAEEAP